MSPREVVARMSTPAVPSFLRELLKRPWPVPAETPAAATNRMRLPVAAGPVFL
jgi:hypothetical protein